MPSVIVSYEGSLEGLSAQERLCARIRCIARYTAPWCQASARDVDERRVGQGVAVFSSGSERLHVPLEEAGIKGTVLRLVDFRGDAHDFSFAFLRDLRAEGSESRKRIGRLVTLEDKTGERWRTYRSADLEQASWILWGSGGTTLRYALEAEFDLLMAYLRTYHVPDLKYWRYSDQPSLPEFAKWHEDVAREFRHGMSLERAALLLEDRLGVWAFPRSYSSTAEGSHECERSESLDLPPDFRESVREEGTIEAIASAMVVASLRSAGAFHESS